MRAPKFTTRREFLRVSVLGAASAAILAACAPAAPPTPTLAPKPTEAPKPAATTAPAAVPTATAAPAPKPTEAPKPTAAPAAVPTPTAAAAAKPAGKPRDVPRNRTLVLMWGGTQTKYTDQMLWNPYAIGATHQLGAQLMYEPLYYFSAFGNKYYPWLAEGHEYSADLKQVTVKLRSGINWSDGTPFSSEDVAFTLNTLNEIGPKVKWGLDVQQNVKEAKAVDPTTVVITFKQPAPRWIQFMSYKYDIGIYIVPKHIFQGQDWTTFTHYDLDKGWPVTTGPWKVVFASPEQKMMDRRDDWWAVKAGLSKMPAVERILWLPFPTDAACAQALITNTVDSSHLSLSPIRQVIQQNPKIITHTLRDSPYGYVDWWPASLYVNNEKPPFDKPDVRWALSYFIDRDQVISVGYQGAGTKSQLPMPSYPPLMPYFDAVKDLLAKYNTNEFNPAKGSELLQKVGFKKGNDGLWVDAKGERIKLPINGYTFTADIGPVLAEQLRRQGIDATYQMPPDAGTQFTQGNYVGQINGHGGSVEDPHATLRLYHGSQVAPIGQSSVNSARWKNDKFNQIVDQMGQTSMEDKAKLTQLFRQAMEIWLPELPDIQLVEWYHRVAMNTAYWKGWPTRDDPYVNGAFWHLTYQLVLNRLESA